MSKYDLLIRGGTVVSAKGRRRLDVAVLDGRIDAVGEPGAPLDAAETIDASGLLVLPGMVDTHVHFMDPGDPSREDFPTGSAAAAARGVTSVIEHTHGWPVTEPDRLREKLAHLDGRSHVDYGLAAHVWPEHLGDLEGLWRAGIAYFKAFTCETHGVPALHSDVLLDLGRILARLDAPCLVHCEDDRITAHDEQRLRAKGRTDGGIIPAWRSREAEMVSVSEVATVARLTGAHLVIAHASSADVLEFLDRERAAGAPVLAETCPQYLHLREEEVMEHGALRKFTPPARIRSAEDEARMWAALREGLVHHLSSDHAPSTLAQKRAGDVWEVHFGLPGIDSTMPLMLDAALRGEITLERLVKTYATGPARLYGLAGKGRVEPGADADLALVDPEARWTLSDDGVISKAGWTPYAGREVRGRVVATLLRGRVIARDGAAPAGKPGGRFLAGAGART